VGPVIAWAVHRTAISFRDVLAALSRPVASSFMAGGLAFGVRLFCSGMSSALPRLLLEGTVLVVTYLAVLLSGSEQRSLYLDLFRGLKRSASVEEKELISA
jgi:hypothetical protein